MQLPEFFKEWTELQGGEWQEEGEELTLLAPSGLGLPELVTLGGEGDALFFGHPYLETALDVARREPAVWMRRALPGPRKNDLAERWRKVFGFRNATGRATGPAGQATLPWVFFHYRVTFVSDDKREELRSVGVDLAQLAPVAESALDRVWLEPEAEPGADRSRLDAAIELSRAWLERAVQQRRARLQREAERHLQVEQARLESYYERLLKDLARRSNAEGKIAQTTAERDARRGDLAARFAMRLEAQLFCLDVVDIPRQVLPFELSRKGPTLALQLSYNPLLQNFDPLPCAGCGEAGYNFSLCAGGHLGCTKCFGECAGCRAELCVGCGAAAPLPRRCAACESAAVVVPEKAKTKAPVPQAPKARPVPRLPAHLLRSFCTGHLPEEVIAAECDPLDGLLRQALFSKAAEGVRCLQLCYAPCDLTEFLGEVLQILRAVRGDKLPAALRDLQRKHNLEPLPELVAECAGPHLTPFQLERARADAVDHEARLLQKGQGFTVDRRQVAAALVCIACDATPAKIEKIASWFEVSGWQVNRLLTFERIVLRRRKR